MNPTSRRLRRTMAGLVSLALILGGEEGQAADAVSGVGRPYVREDRGLVLDLSLRDLFSPRTLNAIQAGMTTTLSIQLRLEAPGRRPVQREIGFLILHDIWEGQYVVLKGASPPDTLRTSDFQAVEGFCSTIRALELMPIQSLRAGEQLSLKFRVRVNTATPEQARRTREWLEPYDDERADEASRGLRIDLGDVIDFFFNIYRPREQSPWIDLGTFVGKFTGEFVVEEVR